MRERSADRRSGAAAPAREPMTQARRRHSAFARRRRASTRFRARRRRASTRLRSAPRVHADRCEPSTSDARLSALHCGDFCLRVRAGVDVSSCNHASSSRPLVVAEGGVPKPPGCSLARQARGRRSRPAHAMPRDEHPEAGGTTRRCQSNRVRQATRIAECSYPDDNQPRHRHCAGTKRRNGGAICGRAHIRRFVWSADNGKRVGWVERSETHRYRAIEFRPSLLGVADHSLAATCAARGDGFRYAQPILRLRSPPGHRSKCSDAILAARRSQSPRAPWDRAAVPCRPQACC